MTPFMLPDIATGRDITGEEPPPPPDPMARRKKFALVGLLVVMVMGSAATLWLVWQNTPEHSVRLMADLGFDHVTAPLPAAYYNSDPPTTGSHRPEDAAWGEHAEPLSRDAQVHALARGAVIVHYNCPDGCADDLAVLRDILAETGSDQVILHPYPAMEHNFALTAWRHILTLDAVEREVITEFITDFRGARIVEDD